MRGLLVAIVLCVLASLAAVSCSDTKPPTAPAVRQRDSSSILTTYGVSKLISDSGRIRYKVVAEEWRVYDRTSPPRHTFPKGILLEKFNQKYHIEMYITADTAYWYDQYLRTAQPSLRNVYIGICVATSSIQMSIRTSKRPTRKWRA